MNAIDELGMIKAQIAELRELEKQLSNKVKGEIFDSGEQAIEGDMYRACLTMSDRKVTDWKKIAMDLGASAQKIRANTKATGYSSLRVSARSTAAKAA
jgi:hypothetical protein